MKTLGIIANDTKKRARDVLERIVSASARHGIALMADPGTAALSGALRPHALDAVLARAEAVIALGGDGTMLRVVRALDGRDTPVVGVNIGGLGFLTSVSEDDLDRALECLATDAFTVSVRSILDCRVERLGSVTDCYRALNDVVVSRGPSARVVTLDLWARGEKVTSYLCDGLIVSTPTGSTGHSLSAGGPILTPETRAVVVSLICPHTLSSRPVVLPDDMDLVIAGVRNDERLLLSVDGQVGQTLQADDRVCVRRSDRSVRFIHLPGYSYFEVLSQKLHWSGRSA